MNARDARIAAVVATVMQTGADDPRLPIVLDVVRSMDALARREDRARAGAIGGKQKASKRLAKPWQNPSKRLAPDILLEHVTSENHEGNTAQQAVASPEREGLGGFLVPVSPLSGPVSPDRTSQPPISDDRQSDERGELWVRTVFDHYRVHHPRAFPRPRSESKEWKAILARMREGYTLADLCKAIDGYHVSPFHRGENESGTKYLDLALIVRDGTHVAKGIELAAGPGPVVSEKERRNHRAAQGVLERVKQLGLGGGK